MGLFNHKCQKCHEGTIREEIKQNYTVELFDKDLEVKEARIGICDNCGAVNYSGKEVERWKKIYQKREARSEEYLGHNQIKKIRGYLGLTQQKFAELIGVSRQSISVWEQPDRPSAQPKSIDKVLKMLYHEIDSSDKPVMIKMINEYNKCHEEEIENYESKTEKEKLKNILPETTYNILKKQSDRNGTEEIVEAVRIIETHVLSKRTQTSSWSKEKYNMHLEEYTGGKRSKEITYKNGKGYC